MPGAVWPPTVEGLMRLWGDEEAERVQGQLITQYRTRVRALAAAVADAEARGETTECEDLVREIMAVSRTLRSLVESRQRR
jgi:hypothetical protein